ncbi:hypothetical protein L3Q82_022460, partial [Scortum barcoo]
MMIISDESHYRAEVEHLATWCADNAPNLLLNTSKTKELIVDFRKVKRETHDPIHINGMAVERVSSFKFLGIHISENLSWTANTSSLIKKAHQRLFFLRTLKKNHPVHCHPRQLLPVCDREYPNQLHHSLVWELLCRGPARHCRGWLLPRRLRSRSLPQLRAMHFEGRQLIKVLIRLLENQLYVKAEKCEFHASSVSFLGFIVSPNQVKMDPEKVSAVTNWPPLTSRKKVQQFLGFTNFYRKFIRNFSAVAAPLHALTSPKLLFQWGPRAEEAFHQLKRLFTTAPVLTMPDPQRQFRPGSQNTKRDVLSRLYEPEPATKEPETILPPDRVVGAVIWHIEKEVQRASQGVPAPEGCPRNQLFVPKALHSQVIHWAHTSLFTCHPGAKRTVFVIQLCFWWPSLAKDVAEYVAACSVCAR